MYLFKISLLLFSNFFIQISTAEHAATEKAKTRKLNGHYDECVCFPAGQSLIPELLNPQGSSLERLVIFLYRDVNNNQIKMFLPSPVKQPLIPNIPFEVGDVLRTITTETIASLFNTRLNNAPNRDQMFTEELPIGLKWGKIEHNMTPKSNVINILQDNPPQGNPQQVYLLNQYNPDQQQQSAVPNNQIKYEVINKGQKIYSWESKNPYQLYGPYNHYQVNAPSPIHPNNLNIYAPKGSFSQEHLTFDQWFNRQMSIFQDTKSPQDIKTINTDTLRSLVQKTLFENHMHIGSTGLITDANGVMINLNNLELRPIMIGNPVTYKQALSGEQQLALPKHLPYLEGLLITLVYPPKILGVIPLGKTYVSQNPQPSSPSALIEHYYTESDSAPNSVSGSNRPNPYPSATYPNNQWVYHISDPPMAHSYGTISSPQYSNMNSPSSDGVPYSASTNSLYANNLSGSQFTGAWKRRSNKFSKKQKASKSKASKQKPQVAPQIPKASTNAPIAPENLPKPKKARSWWFFNNRRHSAIDSRNGRKSGSPSYQNWQPASNSEWEFYSVSQTSPYSKPQAQSLLTARPLGDQWSSSNSVPSNYKPNSSFGPNVNPPALNGVPNSATGLTASPYVDPNQSVYSNTYGISQPIANSPPIPNTNWNSHSNSQWGSYSNTGSLHWHPLITTTAYPLVKSPYLRSEPDPSDTGAHGAAVPIEKITGVIPVPIPKVVSTTPNLLHSFVTDASKSTQTEDEIRDSESSQHQTRPLGGTRRFPLPIINGVLKTLINMVLQNLTEGSDTTGPDRDGGATNKSDHVIESNINITNNIEKTGEIEDGERPDFRIIGGSAATGSGSPLSNKGRSGAAA